MAKSQLSQELYILAKSLLKAWIILFRIYSPYIKTILLAIVAYAAFKIGRKVVADPYEQSIKRLQQNLRNRSYYIITLPERLNKIIMFRKILSISLIILIIIVPILMKSSKSFSKIINKFLLVQSVVIGLIILVLVWSYQLWLNKQISDGHKDNITINQQLYAMTKQLGQRAQGLLRIFLCRQKQLQRPKRPIGQCWKQKCKQERKILKDKYDLIDRLVQSAFTFQWCTVCRSKLPFDQFLMFQAQSYQNQPGLSQQEQVNRKNQYLMNLLIRIDSWIRNISPCNCSKLYWLEQIRQIKHYKKCQKELEEQQLLLKRRVFAYGK